MSVCYANTVTEHITIIEKNQSVTVTQFTSDPFFVIGFMCFYIIISSQCVLAFLEGETTGG